MSDYAATLQMPETMPEDFAEYLRKRAVGEGVTGIIRAKLNATPVELWRVADDATRESDHRRWAFADLWGIIVSSNGLLPNETPNEKAKAQQAAADTLHAAKLKCDGDRYTAAADLKDLLALSAATQTEDAEYVAAVAAALHRLGTGNSGITLPKLLEGLSRAFRGSATALKDPTSAPSSKFDGERLRAEFTGRTASRFETRLAEAQGVRRSIETTSSGESPAKISIGDVPPGACLMIHTANTSFSSLGIDYTPVLYGPFEPIHDADFGKSAPRPQENHLWAAVGLMRWMYTYTGEPHMTLVRSTVDALLGPRSIDDDHKDYVKSAYDRLNRMK